MIPVYRPRLSGRELELVRECLESGWISSRGKFVPEFERRFAEYVGVRRATSTCNGTVALHLALLAAGVGPGDEVIVPALTYVASANAIVMCGATPAFVDSDPDTWQMDPACIEQAITPRTKAVLAVHLYGHPCDMDRIPPICSARGIALVEDCAEAIGTRWRGRHVGTFGTVSTFSFFGNKTITTGEGGMVVSDDDAVMDRAYLLKTQGVSPKREYWHEVLGYNYRMTNVCAAIGCAQMESIEGVVSRKAEIAARYRAGLDLPGVTFHGQAEGAFNSYWMCSALMPSNEARDRVRRDLAEAGIETRPLFFPAHRLPVYADRYGGLSLPVAEDLAARGLNLPSHPGLADGEVDLVCSVLRASIASAPLACGDRR